MRQRPQRWRSLATAEERLLSRESPPPPALAEAATEDEAEEAIAREANEKLSVALAAQWRERENERQASANVVARSLEGVFQLDRELLSPVILAEGSAAAVGHREMAGRGTLREFPRSPRPPATAPSSRLNGGPATLPSPPFSTQSAAPRRREVQPGIRAAVTGRPLVALNATASENAGAAPGDPTVAATARRRSSPAQGGSAQVVDVEEPRCRNTQHGALVALSPPSWRSCEHRGLTVAGASGATPSLQAASIPTTTGAQRQQRQKHQTTHQQPSHTSAVRLSTSAAPLPLLGHFETPTLSAVARTPAKYALVSPAAAAAAAAATDDGASGVVRHESLEAPGGAPCPHWDAFKHLHRETGSFTSLSRWATLAFDQALSAKEKLPPQGNTAEGAGPSKLMTAVSCMIVDAVMGSLSGYEELWPLLRAELFGSIFACRGDHVGVHTSGPAMSETVAATATMSTPQPGPSAPPPHSSRFRLEFGRAATYYERCAQLTSSLEHARKIIAEHRGMAEKFAVISDMTHIHQQRRQLATVFGAWRAVVAQRQRHVDSVGAFGTRQCGARAVSQTFLRWRRFTVLMRWRKTSATLQETIERTNFTISDLRFALAQLQEKYEADIKALEFELHHERESQKNILEGHAVELQEVQMIMRTKDEALASLRKHCRQWQRVAKTLRPVELALDGPPSALLEQGIALGELEGRLLAAFERGVEVEPATASKVRAQLERLLVTWVNLELSAAGVRADPISNTTTDLRDGEILLALSRILRPPTEPQPRGDVDVFTSLVALMAINTNGGLFPPLLAHCPFHCKFFTRERFLQRAHPTAGMWVLASLFVSRALRTPLAHHQSALPLQPSGLQPPVDTVAGEVSAGVGSAPLSAPAAAVPFAMPVAAAIMCAGGDRTRALCPGSARTSPAAAPLQHPLDNPKSTTIGGQRRSRASVSVPAAGGVGPRGHRCSTAKVTSPVSRSLLPPAAVASDSEERSDDEALYGDDGAFADRGGSAAFSSASASDRLPQVPATLAEATLQGTVGILLRGERHRLEWNGLARVVTALVLRHRVLDGETAASAMPSSHARSYSVTSSTMAAPRAMRSRSREASLAPSSASSSSVQGTPVTIGEGSSAAPGVFPGGLGDNGSHARNEGTATARRHLKKASVTFSEHVSSGQQRVASLPGQR